MLISHNCNLVFIHIQKTGGSSITKILTENIPDIVDYKAKHDFAIRGARELSGWQNYFKFAFVRNPWDRLVSWYTMINNAKKIRWDQALTSTEKRKHYRQIRNNKLWLYVQENSNSFEEFVRNCSKKVKVSNESYHSFAFNQLDYLTDESGELLVNFIGRFENFSNDLGQVLKRFDIDTKTIPQDNVSSHKHYSSYYSNELEDIVRERFKKDIEYFDYKFERLT